MRRLAATLLTIYLFHPGVASGQEQSGDYVFSQIDYRDGLSNSAVICLFKDDDELMWLGTYDGLNCFDGRGMEVFRSGASGDGDAPTLDDNVIYGICKGDGDNLWVSTLLGVNRFSMAGKRVVANWSVPHGTFVRSNRRGNTWLVCPDSVAWYNTLEGRFVSLASPPKGAGAASSRSFVAPDGALWLFPDRGAGGEYVRVSVGPFYRRAEEGTVSAVESSGFHHRPVESVFYYGGGSFCFVDADRVLYMYDIGQHTKVRLRSIAPLMERWGAVTGIAPLHDDFMIAFHTNGLVRLRTAEAYREEVVDQNLRIFNIYRDPEQDILWMGLDGKGAMMYARHRSLASNIMTGGLSANFTRQVRSIMTDPRGGLWFGTKGDGLVHIGDYARTRGREQAVVRFPGQSYTARTYVREDSEFSVYALTRSKRGDGFWVGTGSGIYHCDFAGGGLRRLVARGDGLADEVHEIYEADSSTLYVASAGSGFMKLTLDGGGGGEVASVRRYGFSQGQQRISTFFSMAPQGDSILWLGSRERGLVRFDMRTERWSVVSLGGLVGRGVDDVLSLCMTRGGDLFAGTTGGLVRLAFDGKDINGSYAGREHGLLNDMIHGVLEDDRGALWLSTNRGLVKYNPTNGSHHTYYYSGGVRIGEFSDDAYYKCPHTGRLFFGGIDGLLYINTEAAGAGEYYPEIVLRGLTLDGREALLGDHYAGQGRALEFDYTVGGVSLAFAAPDFISAHDIEYSWMLQGRDHGWSPFSASNEASWERLPVGNYVFMARYRKDIFDTEVKSFSIPVRVLPLWWQSDAAKVIFLLAGLGAAACVTLFFRKWLIDRRTAKRLRRSEMRNVPYSAAGGIDRDMADRLTGVYLTCVRMQDEKLDTPEREALAERIREDVMSILLPVEMFRDRRMEASSPARFTAARTASLKKILDEIVPLLRKRGFEPDAIEARIPETLLFPIHVNAFRALLYYVCAFVSEGGRRRAEGARFAISAFERDGTLRLRLGAADRQTLEELHASLSDDRGALHYEAADPAELFWMRLLRDLASSALGQLEPAVEWCGEGDAAAIEMAFQPAFEEAEPAEGRKGVLVLEERDEMFWTIEGMLSTHYAVRNVKSMQQAMETMCESTPAAFIVDMAMYAGDAGALIDYVGRNPSLLAHTAFIPILCGDIPIEQQRKLILISDSHLHLLAPHDLFFLAEIVHKAVYGKKTAKQIHVEGLGGFADFVTCFTDEQADLVRRMMTVIDRNIDREELGSSFLARELAMSSRQFYRKFREVSRFPPTDLIKHCRMECAAELLRHEKMPIAEVMAEVGISSRSWFYKEFSQKFMMTPKEYRDMHRAEGN